MLIYKAHRVVADVSMFEWNIRWVLENRKHIYILKRVIVKQCSVLQYYQEQGKEQGGIVQVQYVTSKDFFPCRISNVKLNSRHMEEKNVVDGVHHIKQGDS